MMRKEYTTILKGLMGLVFLSSLFNLDIQPRKGGFSALFGPTEIELLQRIDTDAKLSPPKIMRIQRLWVIHIIHLCFDVQGMDMLK